MEYGPGASMTHWLQRFLSLFRAETEEVNGMPGVKISNLDDFSAPCQIHLFWFHAEPNLDYCCLLQTKPESTEGGRLVSILKWPEGALLNLG